MMRANVLTLTAHGSLFLLTAWQKNVLRHLCQVRPQHTGGAALLFAFRLVISPFVRCRFEFSTFHTLTHVHARTPQVWPWTNASVVLLAGSRTYLKKEHKNKKVDRCIGSSVMQFTYYVSEIFPFI